MFTRRLVLVLLLLFAATGHTALVPQRLTLLPDALGIISTQRNLSPGQVLFSDIGDTFLGLPEDDPVSVDVRAAFMSGAGAATATISIVDVGGDSAATLGMSISGGDDLVTAAATPGSGTFRLNALYNSVDYRSNIFTFEIIPASVVTDTITPTEAYIFSAVAVSATQVDLEIIPPMDGISPTSLASKIDYVEIWRNTNGGTYTLHHTIDIPGELPLQFESYQIGSVTPAPTVEQDGTSWSITTEGATGFDGSADSGGMFAASLSGNFILTGVIPEYSVPAGRKTPAYIMARESVAAGSKVFSVGRQSNASSGGVPHHVAAKWRTQIDATNGFTPSITPVTDDIRFILIRSGASNNVWSGYYKSSTQTAFGLVSTQTFGMANTLLIGGAAASGEASAQSLVDFEQMALRVSPILTWSDITVTGNKTYGYIARGVTE